MSAVATAPTDRLLEGQRRAERLFAPRARTLEDLVLERWDELVASGRAECPVCGDRLQAAGGCEGCASDLS
jgi:hypothetical protein